MDDPVSLTGDWKKFEVTLDPHRWTKAFEDACKKGLEKLGLIFTRLARADIKDKKYEPNAQATIDAWYERGSADMNKRAAKRAKSSGMSLGQARAAGKTPLIDWGDLMRSIGHKVVGAYELYLGAKKTAYWHGKRYNIAAVLHEGATIRQPKMKRTIVIPSRPFIRQPLEGEEFGSAFKQFVTDAMKKAWNV